LCAPGSGLALALIDLADPAFDPIELRFERASPGAERLPLIERIRSGPPAEQPDSPAAAKKAAAKPSPDSKS